MKGVYVCWLEIFEGFTVVVIHAKVVVEDCISREARHLPNPTQEDHQLEQEYELDPKLEYNLEDISRKEASLSYRTKPIWEVEENHEQTDNK